MSIRIDFSDGLFFPVLACDHCGLRFKTTSMAVAVWDMLEVPSAVYHAHKGECHKMVEKKCQFAGWMELSRHLSYLSHNLKLTVKKQRELNQDGY